MKKVYSRRGNLKKHLKLLTISFLTLSFLVSCGLPGLGGPAKSTIKISALNTSESSTVAYIIKELIEEETDLSVEIIGNIGSSIVQHQALSQGEVDISATRYSGTDLPGALEMDPIFDADEALMVLKKEFKEQFNQKWYDPLGFENSYAFTVSGDLAREENLEKVSDVKPLAKDLRLGVDNAWLNREGDGYQAFTELYDFEFGKAFPMQIGLVYSAVDNDEMDVVLAYSSDGRLEAFDLVTLEDDLQFFAPYEASLVASEEILEEHPDLDTILEKLSGKIDQDTMRSLNYEADVNMKEPALLAKEFLEENNYFKE